MKKHPLLLLGLATMLSSCTQKADSIIGTWATDKVNVQFDERRSTPELVKQIGEMEKQSSIVISRDSLLTFRSLESEAKGQIHLQPDGKMLVDGEVFGQWNGKEIERRTGSPLGEVVVTYRKK